MNGPGAIGSTPQHSPAGDLEKLRRLSKEFEGLFLKQMFDAMRSSVPKSDLIESSLAEETFTSMLDEHLANEAASRSRGGLGDALYRQLSRRMLGGDSSPRKDTK